VSLSGPIIARLIQEALERAKPLSADEQNAFIAVRQELTEPGFLTQQVLDLLGAVEAAKHKVHQALICADDAVDAYVQADALADLSATMQALDQASLELEVSTDQVFLAAEILAQSKTP
jgi:hypothetical protein